MAPHWSRGVSLALSLLSITVSHYADPRRAEPIPRERLGAQALTLALSALAWRYPSRRPQLLLAAAAVGGVVGLLGRRRRGRERVR